MAEANVAQHSAQEVSNEVLNDAQNLLYEAASLSGLVDWIERAKFLCDHIIESARRDKGLEEALHRGNVAYLNACWDTEQSDGLVHLIGHQRRLVEDASTKIGARHV